MTKRELSCTILTLIMFLSLTCNTTSMTTGKGTEHKMYRGINLGNALEAPKEGQWGVIIKDEYFRIIGESGFDTVRIPIRWSAHAEDDPPYKIDDEFFRRVDWVVNKSLEQGLITIINIHHYEEIMQDPAGHKMRFLALWSQISEHYRDYPENLYFELLNEPHGRLTGKVWNEILAEAIRIIRAANPSRKIIVGPANWNGINGLDSLIIPENDKNIIVTFHFYAPFEFTHQGAEWVHPPPPVGKEWLGTETERRQITSLLDTAVKWSKEHGNIPLFLGEFGAYWKADMNSRVRWTYFVAREAERRGIPWCYWEFCAGFGAYDPKERKWREPLLYALIPKPNKHFVSAITDYGNITGTGWYDEGTYATIKLDKTAMGFLVRNVLDHFEGLKSKDKIIDERTVQIYVDGPREIRAVWRKECTPLMLIVIAACISIGILLFILKRR